MNRINSKYNNACRVPVRQVCWIMLSRISVPLYLLLMTLLGFCLQDDLEVDCRQSQGWLDKNSIIVMKYFEQGAGHRKGLLYQGFPQECNIQGMKVKIQDTAMLILTCQVGETIRLNCNTNCPHTWWFSDSDSAPRRQIFSDFYNPPYFYLMV